MSLFLYIAAFLLLRRSFKIIRHTPQQEKWGKMLHTISWLIWPIFVGGEYILIDIASELLSILFLLGVVIFVRMIQDFKLLHPVVVHYYPLLGLAIVTFVVELLIPKKSFDTLQYYFAAALLLAFGWAVARVAASKKQHDELLRVSLRNAELDKLVAERTAELLGQKEELQETIKLLQTTQQQLIQSEKLASLGELTAGIAHEIQNPLNFVNNFSEVSVELIGEMGEELEKGNTEEVIAIANDIKQNLEKIRHHGKRADGIVKGMLQHSRASSSAMELTDINVLADEYLRLAYHGLRAKDKSFNAELITHFEEPMTPVNMVPQDMGRVMLNLFNNAFYAVQKKQQSGIEGFKPTVEVTTARRGNELVVTVKDNGTGIPDDIRDKILQPFFTTKPTGEGTGLGLSLSYDIVVKAHGGKIDIDSKEGEYTAFTISIPAKN